MLSAVFNVSVGAPVTALALSTQIGEKSVPRFLICADAAGTLHTFNKEGTLLLSFPTGMGAGVHVKAMAIGTREDPILTTVATDGVIRVYNMTLPRAVRPPPRSKKEKAEGQRPPPPPPIEFALAEAKTIAAETTVDGAPVSVSHTA